MLYLYVLMIAMSRSCCSYAARTNLDLLPFLCSHAGVLHFTITARICSAVVQLCDFV